MECTYGTTDTVCSVEKCDDGTAQDPSTLECLCELDPRTFTHTICPDWYIQDPDYLDLLVSREIHTFLHNTETYVHTESGKAGLYPSVTYR